MLKRFSGEERATDPSATIILHLVGTLVQTVVQSTTCHTYSAVVQLHGDDAGTKRSRGTERSLSCLIRIKITATAINSTRKRSRLTREQQIRNMLPDDLS